jgi:hypothetical protein
MNRVRAWGVTAALSALVTGAVVPVVKADPPTVATNDDRPWYKRLFFRPPPQNGPVIRSSTVITPPGYMSTGSALPAEVVNDAVRAEAAAWQRRMDVCLKLRAAALERNDDALERQVAELERQINALYAQRVTALGVPKAKAALPPTPSSGAAASFDLAPEKPTDPKAAAARLVAPAQPVPLGTASTQPGPGVREVKP